MEHNIKSIRPFIGAKDFAQQIAKDACADDFLNKPFHVGDIEQKIKKFIVKDGSANAHMAV